LRREGDNKKKREKVNNSKRKKFKYPNLFNVFWFYKADIGCFPEIPVRTIYYR